MFEFALFFKILNFENFRMEEIIFEDLQGKLNLHENEIVICTEFGSVNFDPIINNKNVKALSNEIIIRLTNLRIIISDTNDTFCSHFKIQDIKDIIDHKPLLSFFKKKKLTIILEKTSAEISFNEDKTHFVTHLKTQIEKKSWVSYFSFYKDKHP